MTSRPLRPQTSVRYADARVKQPRPPAKLSSALHRLPPPHRPARDGHRGGKTARFRVDPTGQPCPPTSGKTFRATTTGLQEHGLTLVGTQFQLVLLRRRMTCTARVVLCQPADVTTAPCRKRQPSKAAAPGHGKLGRNPLCTLSGRSADNLEPNGTARTFPDALQSTNYRTTSQSINRQPPTDHQPVPPASR